MPEWPLLVFLGVRLASVPLVQTWFVPDEYWQATEVAHAMAFRYGYKTWEWREGIRGVLYPALLAALFKLLSFLDIDNPQFLIHIPRLLHAVAFAIGDYHIWKLSKVLYGSASARWTVVCLSTAWFLGYCAPRTLTSCVETVLLAVAFSHYPWQRKRESQSAGYLWPVGLACAVRPTAVVPFLPLALQHLWHTHYRSQLLLRYIMITTTVMAFTVGLDSWYYGDFVVVPWRFAHFNVVAGLSSHYGTLPWHWYLSQGIPATLTTHMLPLTLALILQPARHRHLLLVILWSLLIYSCLGHKEFRFLLPVLPLCLCVAGDHITFHLTAYTKRSNNPMGLRKMVIILVLLIPNLIALLYLGIVHQRGPIDTMQVLRHEVEANPQADILFLMPCHSVPYYSHLHKNVTMRFLTCEPNLKGEGHYLDEADLFDKDPLTWLQQEYSIQPPAPKKTLSLGEKEEKNMRGENEGSQRFRNDMRREIQVTEKEGEYITEWEVNGDRREDNINMEKIGVNSKGDYIENKEDINTVEGKYSMTYSSPSSLPSHIVMFSVLKEKVEEFLNNHHYHLCHQLFHSHMNDGRRSQHIHIYCWHKTAHKAKYIIEDH